MSSTGHNLGGKLLLCDDLLDTWSAFNRSMEWLREYPPLKGKIKSIKTAILWKKAKSTFNPDFCAVKLKDSPWIVQPFEKYEEIRVEHLKEKHKK